MRTVLLWVAILGSILVGSALEGLHLGVFFQPTAAIIVFGPILSYLILRVGPTNSLPLVSRVLSDQTTVEDTDILEKIMTLGFLSGSVAGVIGLIHVMSNLSDSSKLGAGIAVAFIGVFYGMIPAMLLTPSGKNGRRMESAKSYLTASVLVLLWAFFVVLYALSRTPSPLQG